MDSVSLLPSPKEIEKAASRISGHIHHTPVFSSELLNLIVGAELVFKCENFQKAGAFKFRGATNALLNLKESGDARIVITHSSGNHAGALAKASSLLGYKCLVVMPSNAPKVKIEAVKYYGAEIIFCESTLKSRETTTEKVIQKTGATFIHPYNNYQIIAGQGTAALELLTVNPDLNIIMAPVGGGGLMSGTAIITKEINSSIVVLGAEPKGADDAYRSFKSGKIFPSVNPDTIADGLLSSLGELTFEAISKHVDDILTVKEDSILEAMKLVWKYMKIIIEPSSAVPLAAVLENRERFAGQKTGIILSGGNIDPDQLPFKTNEVPTG